MRSVFYPSLVNGPFGDPALYVRLAHRGEALLFDCGDLAALTTRELLKVTRVFISHAHIDHLIGFDTLLRTALYRQKPLTLYGPAGIAERIAGRLSGYTWNLIESYPLVLRVREWLGEGGIEVVFRARDGFAGNERKTWTAPPGVLTQTSHFRVRVCALDHGDIPSLAFTLEEPLHIAIHKDALERLGYVPGPWLTLFKDALRGGEAPHTPIQVPLLDGGEQILPLALLARSIAHTERGMKVGYVTDASPTEANRKRIVSLTADAHLLAIEATFAAADSERAAQRNHLTAPQAGFIARQAEAARLLVFHHSPRYQDQPDLLRLEAEAAFLGASPPPDFQGQ